MGCQGRLAKQPATTKIRKMITNVDDYFTKGCGRCGRFETPDCSVQTWSVGIADLRRICRDAGLVETAKWGHPTYKHNGRNIAILGAFKQDFRITFFNGSLLKDPEGILEAKGPNTTVADMIRFTEAAMVRGQEQTIRAYLSEAMAYADAGVKPVKVATPLVLPDELITALDSDPQLADAFHALTPGRQKSYVIILNGAKKPETRVARIERFRDKILAGKGALDR